MISGSVNGELEARIGLTVLGFMGKKLRVTAMIDTGFNGFLTLPLDIIRSLELTFDREVLVVLGDGSERTCETYLGTVIWDRRHRWIPIEAVETQPLVGTALLTDYVASIPFRPGESLVLRRLPSQ